LLKARREKHDSPAGMLHLSRTRSFSLSIKPQGKSGEGAPAIISDPAHWPGHPGGVACPSVHRV